MSSNQSAPKSAASVVKSAGSAKVSFKEAKDTPLSPVAPQPPPIDRDELLGSLTTEQQQRTSARVIKKLRLDDAANDKEKRDPQECDLPKEEEKDAVKINQQTVKQRMPKAIWLTEEKNLFFEALNEYGKDFDSITSHIWSKMKKKGVPETMLKTKIQVSHFYYRTWHKLSKHLHFDENVKKVAQELYALINYGELRKKLSSVNEKTCARLGEMVSRGSLVLRARGRNLRVRTPMCRALRRLNHITERLSGSRVCSRVELRLSARDGAAWARVQAVAHNPRLVVTVAPRVLLTTFISALENRWTVKSNKPSTLVVRVEEDGTMIQKEVEDDDPSNHLKLEPDRMTVKDNMPKKLALHIGPSAKTTIHIPILTVREHLSSQKICFSSYLERMCNSSETQPKIRTPKRQRKDSATDKEKDSQTETKKFKADFSEHKLIDIDETAIDGIELIENLKTKDYDEEKPSTEDEKDMFMKETEDIDENACERDKYMSEREKDSFSEMEDDEKYIKSESDNESDGGKCKGENKFKNLKVKFCIRARKHGGAIYSVVTDDNKDTFEAIKPEESIKNTESSTNKEDLSKTAEDQQKTTEDTSKITEEVQKVAEESKVSDEVKGGDELKAPDDDKPDVDVEMVTKQIRRGWSRYDAGQLSLGDVYLMIGSRSRIELDYWWAEPTAPLPQPTQKKTEDRTERASERDKKQDKTPEKGTDSSLEDDKEKRESDTDIFSPKISFGQDSNDGLSGDERKNEPLLSPEHKLCGTLRLTSKLVNRPEGHTTLPDHLAIMNDRLKRLLALAGNPHILSGSGLPSSTNSNNKCMCGHVCSQQKKKNEKPNANVPSATPTMMEEPDPLMFRHPTPILPKPGAVLDKPFSAGDLPRWRGWKGRSGDRRVVVQRLLPLLPKGELPLPPAPPEHRAVRLAPKPTVTKATEDTQIFILSQSNGQYYFHDGDRRIPITPPFNSSLGTESKEAKSEVKEDQDGVAKEEDKKTNDSIENNDIANFLPSESLSLSPSRLLREWGWGEGGGGGDYSLSSFLHHLEGRPQDAAVESQLQSLMVESSIDYVAKFADLAAEVNDDPDNTDLHGLEEQ